MQGDSTPTWRLGNVAPCFIQESVTDFDTHGVNRVGGGHSPKHPRLAAPDIQHTVAIGDPAVLDKAIEFVVARGILKRVKTLNDDVKVELAHRFHPTLASTAATPWKSRQTGPV